jgi:hypothetical protein
VAAEGAITSIVLALADSMVEVDATGRPHLAQNLVSSANVDPHLVQLLILASLLMHRENLRD